MAVIVGLWQNFLITTIQVKLCTYPNFTRNQHKIQLNCLKIFAICDWIYGNCSKLHIGSYEKIDFKDFKTL